MLRVTQQSEVPCSLTETRACQLMSVSDWSVVCWQYSAIWCRSL